MQAGDVKNSGNVFLKDEVFKRFLPCYLKQVTLRQTVATGCSLPPLKCFSSEGLCTSDQNVISFLMKLEMPFLDTSVVTVSVDSPTLSDHSGQLTNVCINKAEFLTVALTNSEIDILIYYFAFEWFIDISAITAIL